MHEWTSRLMSLYNKWDVLVDDLIRNVSKKISKILYISNSFGNSYRFIKITKNYKNILH